MGGFVRAADWGGTALGEAAGWPAAFRTAVEICLSSPFPCFVAWGEDLLEIHNDAAVPLVSAEHPTVPGRPLRAVWPGGWDVLGAPAERVLRQGESVRLDDVSFPSAAGPYTVSCGPLRDGAGRVAGLLTMLHPPARSPPTGDGPRQSEAGAAFLLAVVDRLQPLTDPLAILSAGAEALRRHLDLAVASFEAVDQPGGAEGHPPEREVFRGGDTAATATIPLYRDGALAARFHASRSGPGPWTPGERDLVREVARRSWEAAGRAQAGTAAQDAQRRLRSLLEGMPQIVWRATDSGERTWSSPQWTAYTGQPEEAARGHGWLAAVHPDDQAATLAAWREARTGGALQMEFRLRRRAEPEAGQAGPDDARTADPAYRWFQARGAPVRDDDGAALEWLCTCTDVDDLRRMAQHQRLLMAELQHRVRNTLSVIRSIIRRTMQASESVDELAMHLDGRIDAFSRVQAAVTRNPERGIDLAQLVADELRARSAREGRRVRIEGVAVALRPKAAEAMALAIHELATNSVKFGALSRPEGRVEVAWAVQPAGEVPRLIFVWRESGVPVPSKAPEHLGFGTEMFERTLPYELDAEVIRDFTPDGLHCTIVLPISDRVVDAETLRELGMAVRRA